MFYVTEDPRLSKLDKLIDPTYTVTQTDFDKNGNPMTRGILNHQPKRMAVAVAWAMNHPGALVTLLGRVKPLRTIVDNLPDDLLEEV